MLYIFISTDPSIPSVNVRKSQARPALGTFSYKIEGYKILCLEFLVKNKFSERVSI